MHLPTIHFLSPGKPCNNKRIKQIEQAIHRKLPKDYAEFIKTTGGGMVSLRNCTFQNIYLPSGTALDCQVEQIFGNGTTDNMENDLADEVGSLVARWGVPKEVLLIGSVLSSENEFFVINYGLAQFSQHAVLYLDTKRDDGYIFIAESFKGFLEKLRPAPGYKDFVPSPLDGEQGIYAARRGPLGKRLRELISTCPIPNMEQILRKAAENIAEDNLIQMYVTEGSFKFQDLIFYLAQNVEAPSGLATWMRSEKVGSRSPIYEILSDSFLTTHEWSAVQYFDAAITGWYESRTQMGVLKKTPDGLKLDEDYVRQVASQFE